MATKELTFDPSRLTALARIRDAKRATIRDLGERYQQLRERRADAQRRANLAQANAQVTFGPAREAADNQTTKSQAEVDQIGARMQELQSEIDALAAEAGEAGMNFKTALAFAAEQGLTIPTTLADEAAVLDRTFAPGAR
jgi:chromosome segregation ATPase